MLKVVHVAVLSCAALGAGSCQLMPSFDRVQTVVYDCDGRRMMVAYNPQERTASVSWPDEPLFVLSERNVSRGFYYSDGRRALRGGDRDRVSWETRPTGVVTCTARDT